MGVEVACGLVDVQPYYVRPRNDCLFLSLPIEQFRNIPRSILEVVFDHNVLVKLPTSVLHRILEKEPNYGSNTCDTSCEVHVHLRSKYNHDAKSFK